MPEVRPQLVRVFGVDVAVRYVEELEDRLGLFDATKLEIQVLDGLNAENTRLVLWHELTHVVEVLLEIKVSEAGICGFSTGFIQIMRDNPILASWSFGVPERTPPHPPQS
jgi:hypothetical protein